MSDLRKEIDTRIEAAVEAKRLSRPWAKNQRFATASLLGRGIRGGGERLLIESATKDAPVEANEVLARISPDRGT